MFETEPLFSGGRGPCVVRPVGANADLEAVARAHRDDLEDLFAAHGAILFRGFQVGSAEEFGRFAAAVSDERLDYLYGSTPRTNVGGRVFTASEYPASEEIPLHNENAYQRTWPLRIAFCALKTADRGGETPIAPMDAVTAAIPEDVARRFDERGVQYVRHYHEGLDVPWRQVFRTESRFEVERFCAGQGIEASWLADDVLRTAQTCQGVARHPVSGEPVFFNQAHLFHASSLGEEEREMIADVFGDQAPRHARFGDGSEIADSDLASVRMAFKANEIAFPWRRGDVMLLDNMRWSHGRRPFAGERQVLAVLLDPYSPTRTAAGAATSAG